MRRIFTLALLAAAVLAASVPVSIFTAGKAEATAVTGAFPSFNAAKSRPARSATARGSAHSAHRR